jgi:hypothetical protein
VAWIHRGRDRRRQVHIAETHHQVGGVVDDALHLLLAVQPVDAPDELDVARAPGRVRTDRLHVLACRKLRLAVVPGQRQVHDARWHLGRGQVLQFHLRLLQRLQQLFQRELPGFVVDLKAAHAGRHFKDAGHPLFGQPVQQCLHAEA